MALDLANLNVTDVVATSWYSRRKDIADGTSNQIALLKAMQKQGRILETDGEGGFIAEPLFYADNDTAMFYSGYQTLDT